LEKSFTEMYKEPNIVVLPGGAAASVPRQSAVSRLRRHVLVIITSVIDNARQVRSKRDLSAATQLRATVDR